MDQLNQINTHIEKNKHTVRKILIGFGILLFVTAAAAPSYYFYMKYQQASANSSESAEKELQQVRTEVNKLIQLPEGEEPVLATVSDVERIKDQPFFSKSKNGDKVLIYTAAKKAFLYRPSLGKLIEVTNLNMNADLQAQAEQSSQIAGTQEPSEVRVLLRNGSGVSGITYQIEDSLKAVAENATIIKRENAASTNYSDSLVIPLNTTGETVASKLANELNMTVSQLPEGEIQPTEGDLVVIVGADKSVSTSTQ